MVQAQPADAVVMAPSSGESDNPPESQRRTASLGAPEAIFWHGLITGALTLVDATCDQSSCVAVFRERSLPAPKLSSLELLLLCRAFSGEPQKNLAFDLAVSPATVSQVLGTARAKLGLGARVASTPLPIVFLALRYCGAAELPSVRLGRVQREGHEYSELRWSPLDPDALTELSQVERRVALQFAWGASYKEIAAHRGTSMHTVANQIASICGKLHVRGRFELIRSWAKRQWGMPKPGPERSCDGSLAG